MTARRGVLEALADEIAEWDRTIQAQRLLFWQMHHAPEGWPQERAALLGLMLFGQPVFTEQVAA